MKTWLTMTAAALLFAGCGGASRSDGTGANAGTSGSGGTTGSGGSSGAGNGGVGGGVGGGGVGGGGVGGGQGGAGGSIYDQIAELCAQVDQLPCKVDHCMEDVSEAAQAAMTDGCSGEFAALIACGLAHPLLCVAGADGPQFDIVCQPQLEAYEDCGGMSGTCAMGGGPNGCEVWCEGPEPYSASCTTNAGGNGLTCTCTSGSNSGAQFIVPGTCSDAAWSDAVDAQCTGG